MGGTRVAKFVRSLALDFPDICPQFFMGNLSRHLVVSQKRNKHPPELA